MANIRLKISASASTACVDINIAGINSCLQQLVLFFTRYNLGFGTASTGLCDTQYFLRCDTACAVLNILEVSHCEYWALHAYSSTRGFRRGWLTLACGSAPARHGRKCRPTRAVSVTVLPRCAFRTFLRDITNT